MSLLKIGLIMSVFDVEISSHHTCYRTVIPKKGLVSIACVVNSISSVPT